MYTRLVVRLDLGSNQCAIVPSNGTALKNAFNAAFLAKFRAHFKTSEPGQSGATSTTYTFTHYIHIHLHIASRV